MCVQNLSRFPSMGCGGRRAEAEGGLQQSLSMMSPIINNPSCRCVGGMLRETSGLYDNTLMKSTFSIPILQTA